MSAARLALAPGDRVRLFGVERTVARIMPHPTGARVVWTEEIDGMPRTNSLLFLEAAGAQKAKPGKVAGVGAPHVAVEAFAAGYRVALQSALAGMESRTGEYCAGDDEDISSLEEGFRVAIEVVRDMLHATEMEAAA